MSAEKRNQPIQFIISDIFLIYQLTVFLLIPKNETFQLDLKSFFSAMNYHTVCLHPCHSSMIQCIIFNLLQFGIFYCIVFVL